MGLGQSSKAPVTDDTDEGECARSRHSHLSSLSCVASLKSNGQSGRKSFGLFSAPWIGCNENPARLRQMFLMLMPVL